MNKFSPISGVTSTMRVFPAGTAVAKGSIYGLTCVVIY